MRGTMVKVTNNYFLQCVHNDVLIICSILYFKRIYFSIVFLHQPTVVVQDEHKLDLQSVIIMAVLYSNCTSE